jgi:UDP-hydrolysing UDP-N-acetyl-D-glucosamine 2-epimerase
LNNKKKIAVVVASRANYGRIKYVMKAIQEHTDLELQLIVGASVLLSRFGNAIKEIENDGFKPIRSINYVIEGETLTTQAKSTGLGILEISTALTDLAPDAVITVADRFETMATAIATTYLNIPLIHIQGGEVSGNIDDRVRHAITKLADYHFPSSENAAQRIISMGEDPSRVFNKGCPAMDTLIHNDLEISNNLMEKYSGVGHKIDWRKPYILMVQHPVTTSYGQGFEQVSATLNALLNLKDMQKVVLWPNIDAGSDDVSKGIRVFRENHYNSPFRYYKNFSPEDYARVLRNAKVAVGNSSSFIREGSFLGVPAVIVGDRQKNREHGENVVFSEYNEVEISKKIQDQLSNANIKAQHIFGQGNAGSEIAKVLSSLNLTTK